MAERRHPRLDHSRRARVCEARVLICLAIPGCGQSGGPAVASGGCRVPPVRGWAFGPGTGLSAGPAGYAAPHMDRSASGHVTRRWHRVRHVQDRAVCLPTPTPNATPTPQLPGNATPPQCSAWRTRRPQAASGPAITGQDHHAAAAKLATHRDTTTGASLSGSSQVIFDWRGARCRKSAADGAGAAGLGAVAATGDQ